MVQLWSVNCRPSGTEDVVRVYAEAETQVRSNLVFYMSPWSCRHLVQHHVYYIMYQYLPILPDFLFLCKHSYVQICHQTYACISFECFRTYQKVRNAILKELMIYNFSHVCLSESLSRMKRFDKQIVNHLYTSAILVLCKIT